MSVLPTGTVSFLFTDMEGSTSRWEQHSHAMQAVLGRHDEILRTTIEAHAGHVFKSAGDAFCAAFANAADAVLAAVDCQCRLAAEDWSTIAEEVAPPRVRIGVHTGLVDERDGDYFGRPVNRVARLMSVEKPSG